MCRVHAKCPHVQVCLQAPAIIPRQIWERYRQAIRVTPAN